MRTMEDEEQGWGVGSWTSATGKEGWSLRTSTLRSPSFSPEGGTCGSDQRTSRLSSGAVRALSPSLRVEHRHPAKSGSYSLLSRLPNTRLCPPLPASESLPSKTVQPAMKSSISFSLLSIYLFLVAKSITGTLVLRTIKLHYSCKC